MNIDYNFTVIDSYGSNYQYSSICSDKGLALTRWQAIILTNGDYFTGANMRLSASMS